MTRIQKGKNIRLPESALPMLEELRDKMKRTTHIGGMLINPIVKLGDGVVVGWALAMTNFLMDPKFSVINREDFADKFDKVLAPHLADLASCTDDERLARLKLLVATTSVFSGYSADDPLRAATPEGGKPS